jgi:hypothetical protein
LRIHRVTRLYLLRHRTAGASLLLAALLGQPGCHDNNTNVIAPTPAPPVVDTLTGTLTPFSARIHGFVVLNAGLVTATLTDFVEPDPDPDPDNPTVVGLDIGTLVGTTCQVVVSRTDVVVGQAVSGAATAAGNLCVRIFDSSNTGLPSTSGLAYTITVNHF